MKMEKMECAREERTYTMIRGSAELDAEAVDECSYREARVIITKKKMKMAAIWDR
jgi:hypothetical protein